MNRNPLSGIMLAMTLWIPLQAVAMQNDTIWNQTDTQGRKQGHWKKLTPEGIMIYRGVFKDDRPVGLMERFYESGQKQADLNYTEGSNVIYAVLYNQNGQPAAMGRYIDTQKDSIWSYFSGTDSSLLYTETYLDGKKNGKSVKFYPGGPAAEILYWKDGLKDGIWQQFYVDTTLRLSSTYLKGQLQGEFTVYNTEGLSLVNGTYVNGKMDGTWTFRDNDGNLVYRLEYDRGKLQNEEVRQDLVNQYMDEVEKKLGTIPEIDYDNFFER